MRARGGVRGLDAELDIGRPDSLMTSQKSINAKVLANSLLSASVGQSSAAVDKFSVWLFAGFGAAVGLLFANLDTVLVHVPASQLRSAAVLFVWSMLATVMQRYLAVLVAAAAGGVERGREIFVVSGIPPTEVDLEVLLNELSRPLPGWAAKWLKQRHQAGDFAAISRVIFRGAQLQGAFALVQIGLLFAAAFTLVSSLAA